MSGLKAIRRRLSSVKNTKQITRAMKLVSAAKLKRAQDAALGGRRYSERIGDVLQLSLGQLPEDREHPLTLKRPVAKRAFVVFSGERGLCGGYNTNVAKYTEALRKKYAGDSDIKFYVVGRRTEASATRLGWNLVQSLSGLGEDPGTWPLNELGSELVRSFEEGEVDEVTLVYTRFITTMNLEVVSEQLLPFAPSGDDKETSPKSIKMEPSPEAIFDQVLPLVLKTKLFQAGFEAKACEHAARMTAMDSATRNADELTEKLLLFYNRARQRAITAELLDILGGAEAQKG